MIAPAEGAPQSMPPTTTDLPMHHLPGDTRHGDTGHGEGDELPVNFKFKQSLEFMWD
jgi:hypothetical protein